eukprot:CAMPEP_0179951656 /NCGR_PEP_ID=MMETSP0983-20121128/23790_1 /TAXON_ID=483367 /ORGANISM="non described non described, Strain CCMP 2436" /LENGTH=76 /DNA_ID=CAMNT_0021862087 /DNA_START=18 /DNA_END=245 /DNA_ORIENTATION=+
MGGDLVLEKLHHHYLPLRSGNRPRLRPYGERNVAAHHAVCRRRAVCRLRAAWRAVCYSGGTRHPDSFRVATTFPLA